MQFKIKFPENVEAGSSKIDFEHDHLPRIGEHVAFSTKRWKVVNVIHDLRSEKERPDVIVYVLEG